MNRRLHLSKTKHSKFNESGQLAVFYLFSFIWGCSILTAVHSWWLWAAHTENVDLLLCCFHLPGGLCNKSHFPLGELPSHPYGVSMPSLFRKLQLVSVQTLLSAQRPPLSSFQVKFFYICQIAYWLHALPELYFQKVRKVRRNKGGLEFKLLSKHCKRSMSRER